MSVRGWCGFPSVEPPKGWRGLLQGWSVSGRGGEEGRPHPSPSAWGIWASRWLLQAYGFPHCALFGCFNWILKIPLNFVTFSFPGKSKGTFIFYYIVIRTIKWKGQGGASQKKRSEAPVLPGEAVGLWWAWEISSLSPSHLSAVSDGTFVICDWPVCPCTQIEGLQISVIYLKLNIDLFVVSNNWWLRALFK